MPEPYAHENKHGCREVLIVFGRASGGHTHVVSYFVEDNRFAHSPRFMGWDRDHTSLVMRARTTFAVPNSGWGDAVAGACVVHVGDHLFEATETQLNRGLQSRSEEVDGSTTIEE